MNNIDRVSLIVSIRVILDRDSHSVKMTSFPRKNNEVRTGFRKSWGRPSNASRGLTIHPDDSRAPIILPTISSALFYSVKFTYNFWLYPDKKLFTYLLCIDLVLASAITVKKDCTVFGFASVTESSL